MNNKNWIIENYRQIYLTYVLKKKYKQKVDLLDMPCTSFFINKQQDDDFVTVVTTYCYLYGNKIRRT